MIKRVLLYLFATVVCCQLISAQDFSSTQSMPRCSSNMVFKGEVLPVFPGGESALNKYLKVQYPCEVYCCSAYDRNPIVELTVGSNGVVGSVKIVKSSACPKLDSIAKYHIVAMPDWQPATKGDKAVPYTFQLEIDYNRFVDKVNAATSYEYPFKNGITPKDSFPDQTSSKIKGLQEREVMPEFPGGQGRLMYFLSSMPHKSVTVREMLEVKISFNIEIDGSISNVTVNKTSGNELFDLEAVDYIKTMPKWSPGYLDGVPVRVEYIVPIKVVK